MQAGHFVRRSTNPLRYDEENVNAQCDSCNVWKHGEQYAYSIALDMKYGKGTAKKLYDQRHDKHQFTVEELQKIIELYTPEVDFYLKQLQKA